MRTNKKMIQNPSGILQITPESLEALLLHKHGMITKLFSVYNSLSLMRYILYYEMIRWRTNPLLKLKDFQKLQK